MKILHIALNYIIEQAGLNKVLQDFATEYKQIDWIKLNKEIGTINLRKLIVDTSNKFMPDVTFMQIQNPNIIDVETAKQLKGFVMNWTGDVRQPLPKWYYEIGKEINLTLFTNFEDINKLKLYKTNSDYLQIGYDDVIFKKHSDINLELKHDIVFMGNNYGKIFPLSEMREAMIRRLKINYNNQFIVYGTGWEYLEFKKNLMFKEVQESITYNQCKMAINLSHYNLPRYSSDRIFRIMGSGALCLTKWYPEIEKDFSNNEHLIIWHTLPDLIDKINYFLVHETERKQIAENGYNLVKYRDIWQKRINSDLKLILEKWMK